MATARPMCQSWYERAGDYRPWHFRAEGCTCRANAHRLPEQHGEHCPVYKNWLRADMLSRLTPGATER